ncbi:hypothetical protein [Saccharothrix yanglingensis]|uniref:Uncharacterized protein n=1 Tax=Saccharothrix yanglingensis TaxID=659496 RepID=A0ABU0X6K7_9PSEU|nr:hypothetical protein [Saccharothrix yanglingensis]MDQ2587267.1 hypothetical protein [Saccharothrix yanglingensis]
MNAGGHGVPTRLVRYVEPDEVRAEVDGPREAFRAHGQPALQRALEESDRSELLRVLECPVRPVVALEAPALVAGLIERYLAGR